LAVVAYGLLALALTWEVLPHLTTRLIHDEIDPLLIAAILQWNATHIPLSDAWWQLPIFHPTRDALAFSEHLLGVSVISAPIAWVTGQPILTANLVVLLTFPLCGWAAFALARHLTGSAGAGFIAGLVFAFGPYRLSQLAHLQMLSAQWIPLGLLSLHRFLDTGRRRWLVAFGAAWLLQVLSNGYALFFYSAFVALWIVWFVVGQRRWPALWAIASAWLVASLPVVPVLWTYVRVHRANGFVRGSEVMAGFSADVLGVFCAPYEVSLWGWLQFACRGEGILFPGVATALLCAAGAWRLRHDEHAAPRGPRALSLVRRLLLVLAVAQLASAVATIAVGPWRLELGPLAARGTSATRPLVTAVTALTIAYALSPAVWAAARRAQALGFYLTAAAVMWWCALGPQPVVLGQASGLPGPFALLMRLPGLDSLRVPSRFWLMATLGLAVVAAYAVEGWLRRVRPARRHAVLAAVSVLVLSDGWEAHVPSGLVPPGPPNPSLIRGERVLFLPAGNHLDVFPTYYSVAQGWTAVNGYSGFEPTHYDGVRQGTKLELDGLLTYYRTLGNLHVVVAADAPRLAAFVERQPGVLLSGRSEAAVQYRLPKLVTAAAVPAGEVLRIATATSSCPPADVLVDRRVADVWTCEPQIGRETITLTLAGVAGVAAVRLTQGRPVEFPRLIRVETSLDGEAWTGVYEGDVVGPFMTGALAAPVRPVLVVPLRPTNARVVRIRQVGNDPASAWSLREVEVLGRAVDR
jgi:hypothetical protein